jgi:hypothetical protein
MSVCKGNALHAGESEGQFLQVVPGMALTCATFHYSTVGRWQLVRTVAGGMQSRVPLLVLVDLTL